MGFESIAGGRDTFAAEQFKTGTHAQRARLLLSDATGDRGWVYLGMPSLKNAVTGRTVVSAALSVGTRGMAASTITVALIDVLWTTDEVSWRNRPAVRAGTVSEAVPATADGERWSVDVAALCQRVADGEQFLGFRITTTAMGDNRLYGFEAGSNSWQLDLELSDAPDVPTALAPQGVTATGAPVSTWVFEDAGIEGLTQDAYQVQVDPAADEVSPAFDSGTVASVLPQIDLSTAVGFTPLTSGQATQWRVRVQANGRWSDWSDWVTWSFVTLVTGSVTSPSGATIFDPSPIIEATFDSPITQYQVFIQDAADSTRNRFASRRIDISGTLVQHQVPAMNNRGVPVFAVVGNDYRVVVRGWDRSDREPTPGVPDYREVERVVTLTGGAVPPLSHLTVSQVDASPTVRLAMARSEAPDGLLVERNGVVHARLDYDDPANGDLGPVVQLAPGMWEWFDHRGLPWTDATYDVRAIVNGETSAPLTRTIEARVEGVWLRAADGTQVVLDGAGMEAQMADRRTVHKPIYAQHDVDILTEFEGWSGSYKGTFDETTPDQATARADLKHIKALGTESVRLSWGTVSVPVILRDLTPAPSGGFMPQRRQHDVSFSFAQVGEFEVSI